MYSYKKKHLICPRHNAIAVWMMYDWSYKWFTIRMPLPVKWWSTLTSTNVMWGVSSMYKAKLLLNGRYLVHYNIDMDIS